VANDEARGTRMLEDRGSYDLWYVLRYDDIRSALHDYELFSSRSVRYLGDGPRR
jgi:hypothetical protein